MVNRLLPPVLTRRRIVLACCVAVVTDAIQILLGPFGWEGVDQVIDIFAMILQTLILGYHPLFLPTFVLKAVPIINDFPSWTACTLIVIAVRRKQHTPAPPPVVSAAAPAATHDVIDV
jgi:hypothetical protein